MCPGLRSILPRSGLNHRGLTNQTTHTLGQRLGGGSTFGCLTLCGAAERRAEWTTGFLYRLKCGSLCSTTWSGPSRSHQPRVLEEEEKCIYKTPTKNCLVVYETVANLELASIILSFAGLLLIVNSYIIIIKD